MVAFELFPHIFYPCKHQWNAIKWQRPAISTPMTIKSSELSQKQRATKQCHTQIKLLLNNSNTKKKKAAPSEFKPNAHQIGWNSCQPFSVNGSGVCDLKISELLLFKEQVFDASIYLNLWKKRLFFWNGTRLRCSPLPQPTWKNTGALR